jgi:hypothetical protein
MTTQTLGALLTKLHKARTKQAAADAKAKEAKEEVDAAKIEVIEALKAAGTEKAADKHLAVTLKQTVVPNVKDWDAFYAFIKKNNYFHLLHRRVSDPAWRELNEKKPVPGTEPFTKIDLGITTVK